MLVWCVDGGYSRKRISKPYNAATAGRLHLSRRVLSLIKRACTPEPKRCGRVRGLDMLLLLGDAR